MPLRTGTVCSIFFVTPFLTIPSRIGRGLPPQWHLGPCGRSILGALHVVNVPPGAELWYGSVLWPVGFLLELSPLPRTAHYARRTLSGLSHRWRRCRYAGGHRGARRGSR